MGEQRRPAPASRNSDLLILGSFVGLPDGMLGTAWPSMRATFGAPVGDLYTGVVVAGMSVFFIYTGLEVGAGQWEASYCRGHLNMSAGATAWPPSVTGAR